MTRLSNISKELSKKMNGRNESMKLENKKESSKREFNENNVSCNSSKNRKENLKSKSCCESENFKISRD